MAVINVGTLILAEHLMEKQQCVLKALLTLSTTCQEDDSLNSKLFTLKRASDEILTWFESRTKEDVSIDTLCLAKVLIEHEIADTKEIFGNEDDTGMLDAAEKIEDFEKALQDINLYLRSKEI